MNYVNLGCGKRFHLEWINIDVNPQSPQVIAQDLSKGIPLSDLSCDVVYHSHLLEHLRRNDALKFMKECHRVLKPGGILRVATPDLERICRIYLEKLDGVLCQSTDTDDHVWILLEMYDQTVREKSGGEMADYLRQNPLPNEAFVYERIGEMGRQLVATYRKQEKSSHLPATPKLSWRARIRQLPSQVKYQLLQILLGSEGMRALEIGRFRLAGEVHQWMYDRYSLSQLMLSAGFVNPIVQTATDSQIDRWSSFHLDTLADGTVIKPDSLFMEAVKLD